MGIAKVILQHTVPKEWIDYNGHMNDADYVRAFSWGVDRFMEVIGVDEQFREKEQFTMFTLENHICYLDEMKEGEAFEVHLQVLDYDEKRTHLFLELFGEAGKRAATSEQMLMGIDQKTGRSGSFVDEVFAKIKDISEKHTTSETPNEVGRVIGINRRK